MEILQTSLNLFGNKKAKNSVFLSTPFFIFNVENKESGKPLAFSIITALLFTIVSHGIQAQEQNVRSSFFDRSAAAVVPGHGEGDCETNPIENNSAVLSFERDNCAGTAVLSYSGTTSNPIENKWVWYKDGSEISTNASITVSNSGNYQVMVRRVNCTNGAAFPVGNNLSLTILDPPDVTSISNNNTTPCISEAVTLTVNHTNGFTNPTYEWYQKTSGSSYSRIEGATNKQLKIPQDFSAYSGWYDFKCVVSDNSLECGSSWTETINNVLVSPQVLNMTFGGAISYCENSSTPREIIFSDARAVDGAYAQYSFDLYKNSAIVYSKSGFDGSIANGIFTLSFGSYLEGSYTLKISKPGCSGYTHTNEMNITKIPMETASVASEDLNKYVCKGGTTEIRRSSPNVMLWATEDASSPLNNITYTATEIRDIPPLVNQEYYWVGLPVGGCVNTTRIPISVSEIQEPNSPELDQNNLEACSNSGVNFTIKNPDLQLIYKWYDQFPSGSLQSIGHSFVTDGLNDGEYNYHVIAVNPECENNPSSITTASFTLYPTPSVEIFPSEEINVCEGESYELSTVIPPHSGNRVSWRNVESGIAIEDIVYKKIPTEGQSIETIELTQTSPFGCVSTANKTIYQHTPVGYVPEYSIDKLDETGYQLSVINTSAEYNYVWIDNSLDATTPRIVNNAGTYLLQAIDQSTGCREHIAYVDVLDVFPKDQIVDTDNYVRSVIYRTETVTDHTNASQVKTVTSFYDGLGRPIQEVVKKHSKNEKDIVQITEYNALGRVARNYLPYESNDNSGALKSDAFIEQQNFYTSNNNQVANSKYAFGLIEREKSPLDRVSRTHAPGKAWVGLAGLDNNRGVELQYESNGMDEVRYWTVEEQVVVDNGTYAPGTLNKTVTTDENGNQVQEFKNMEGQIILKKVQLSASVPVDEEDWLQTYYIYDDFGNLRFVLPPAAMRLSK